jgi:hypothetical protein
VDEQVQALADRLAIAELLADYCTALDSRDWDGLRRFFAPGAGCDYGSLGSPRGVDAIIALISGTLRTLDATQHLIGNVTAAVDGDEATAGCYLISEHVRTGTPGGEHYTIGGRYADRLVRTPEGWRVTSRTLHRMWTAGNREVVQRP